MGGVYELSLMKPLGIAFEEVEPGKGVHVLDCVDGGNALADGTIQPGDVLIAVSACKEFGPRRERKLLPAKSMDFDTVIAAITSNDPRFYGAGWKKGTKDVTMMFYRPGEGEEAKVDEFLE